MASQLQVKGGAFVLEGRLVASQLEVESGGWLRGNGTLEGDLLAEGHIAPGGPASDNVGTQRVEGAATFNPGSRFYVYATGHEALDRLVVTGTVDGDCEVVAGAAPGAVPVNEIIIRGDAASSFGNFTPDDTWVWRATTTGSVDLLLTHLRGDSDANGLPDYWEIEQFNVRTGTDPFADEDTDQYDNLSEYLANTDPNDDESLLRIARIACEDGGAQVLWDTADGRLYTLLTSTNLISGQWMWTTTAVLSAYSQPQQAWTSEVSAVNRQFGVRVEEYRP